MKVTEKKVIMMQIYILNGEKQDQKYRLQVPHLLPGMRLHPQSMASKG